MKRSRAVEGSEDAYPLGPALDFLQRIWQLNHAVEGLSSRMYRRLGVTAQQRLLIRCIGRYPGIPAGQIAHVLRVDPGTISAALKRLEKKGLITRTRDPKDTRRAALGLTGKGRALDRPTAGTVEQAVKRLLSRVAPHELATTVTVIDALTALVERLG